mgnify:FL=1
MRFQDILGDQMLGAWPETLEHLAIGPAWGRDVVDEGIEPDVDTHGLTPVALAAEDDFVTLRVFAPSDSRERNR